MLSDEEKEKLEQEFQYALESIISKIKGETATAIVNCEQPMIMLFNKLIFKLEKIKDLENDLTTVYLNGVYDGEKKVEDKIKVKIEEYDETLYYAETEEGMSELKDYEYDEAKYGKKILQSLLEKE